MRPDFLGYTGRGLETLFVLETLQQDPQETQVSDTLETNKLPQKKQTSAPIGLDDIIISGELEQV